MEYKINYKDYEFIITQNEDGTFNIPEEIRDLEPFGTALKPASEYIVLARKPLSEKSVAENVLKWGTGGINVDGCRVGSETISSGKSKVVGGGQLNGRNTRVDIEETFSEGRFPANLILECICDEVIKGEKGEIKITMRDNDGGMFMKKNISEAKDYNDKGDIHTNPMCPCRLMDEQSGLSKSNPRTTELNGNPDGLLPFGQGKNTNYSDKGGASRFFYQAKVNKKERNMGLDGFEDKKLHNINQLDDRLRPDGSIRETPIHKNNHPTLKPVNLMAYLCRLVTPSGGVVLDPFMGSGSTGISALLEGFRFVGMELDADYFKIAQSRIENYELYREFLKK